MYPSVLLYDIRIGVAPVLEGQSFRYHDPELYASTLVSWGIEGRL